MRTFAQRSLCLLALLCAPVFGQDEEEPEPSRAFQVIGYGDSFFDDILFEREKEGETVRVSLVFHPDRRSAPYQIAADTSEVRFFSVEKNQQGRERRVERGRARFPSGGGDALLLFETGPAFAQKGTYRITVMDESEEEWGPGCFRFLNFSGVPLHCQLGEFSGALEEGLSGVVGFPLEGREPLPLRLGVDADGKRKIVYATETLPDLNSGKLLVIKPPHAPNSLRLRVLTLW
ncbi:hypothetical protein [Pelagicoccus sp. SDUM812002]|uniref:hypothetical protein n=1 Tax=Pelagicoccus sp. SDUM812002 TaxID=3041266 RepID=UPI00280FD79F|nr:hypothetical protein [Pelagicoccus sp. SDUM812002]MDQ8187562.1 hypothetical protein [Pelagicoccus sp. SDUM812002]